MKTQSALFLVITTKRRTERFCGVLLLHEKYLVQIFFLAGPKLLFHNGDIRFKPEGHTKMHVISVNTVLILRPDFTCTNFRWSSKELMKLLVG